MATLNLYVSDALKAAMGEHELNWSRIATQAFETAINLERTKTMSIEEASLERLRASRAQASEQREAQGVLLGKQWALETAEFDELERVANIDPDSLSEVDDSYLNAVACALEDQEDLGYKEVGWALEPIFGRTKPTFAEVFGFVNGAAEIFNQV